MGGTTAAGAKEALPTPSEQPKHDRLAWRLFNVALLGLGWCLTMSAIFINIAVTTVAATEWTSVTYATFPVGLQMLTSALTLVPLAHLGQRIGRRPVFVGAALLAAGGSALLVAGAQAKQYWLLLLGAALQGPSFSVAQGFRFVSAEFFTNVPGYGPEWRARAISLTVGCATFAAAIGPESTRHVRDAMEKRYTASYLIVVGLMILQAIATGCVDYGLLVKQQKQAAAAAAGSHMKESPPGVEAVKEEAEEEEEEEEEDEEAAGNAGKGGAGSGQQGSTAGLKGAAALVEGREEAAAHGSRAGQGAEAGGGVKEDAHVRMALGTEQGKPQASSVSEPTLVPVRQVLLSPTYVVPALSGALSFCTMAALMAGSPVLMKEDKHSYDESTYTIEAHVVAMYLPAVLVGDYMNIIKQGYEVMTRWASRRAAQHQASAAQGSSTGCSGTFALAVWSLFSGCWMGPPLPPLKQAPAGAQGGQGSKEGSGEEEQARVALETLAPPTAHATSTMVLGAALLAASYIIALCGDAFAYYVSGLTLLGVGWAFNYVAASSLVAAVFVKQPHVRVAVQGAMDTAVVILTSIANASAGTLVRSMGHAPFMWLYLSIVLCLLLLDVLFHAWCGRQHILQQLQAAKAPGSGAV